MTLNQLNIQAPRRTSALRFLLEGVKDVDRIREPHRIHGAKCVAAIILDHFHHPSPAKTSQGLRVAVLAAALRDVQGIAHVILYVLGEFAQILAARSHPDYRLERRLCHHCR
jgi:hypothetical protein